jgi:hypothetical protein
MREHGEGGRGKKPKGRRAGKRWEVGGWRGQEAE